MPAGRPSIYVLRDPRNGEVRYVGKAENPAARLVNHISVSRHHPKTPVARWVAKLVASGLRPTMEIVEVAPDWEKAERAWIARYGAEGARLLNISAGGLDMQYAQRALARRPAYRWLLQRAMLTNSTKLRAVADQVKRTMREHVKRGTEAEYEAELRKIIGDALPFAARALEKAASRTKLVGGQS